MVSAYPSRNILLIVLFLISCFFSVEVGIRRFATPDEGRYVEMSREMAETHDYITPRLNGVKYFEKPPLFMWAESAVVQVASITFSSMRILSIIFAVFGCAALMFAAWKAYGLTTAVISSSVLSTSLLYYVHSRFVSLDLPFSAFMSAALWCYFLACVRPPEKPINNKLLLIGFYAFSALAVLTKGLIGVLLPGLTILTWLIFSNNSLADKWKIILKSLYVPGILIFFLIAAPWHVMCAIKNQDFAYFYFIHEHFIRYTTNEHCRYQPVWFLIPILIAALLPWTGICLTSMKDAFKKKSSDNTFLLSWILSILCFFSLSHSKLIPYIIPILPPIAMLTGRSISEYVNSAAPFRRLNSISVGFYISMCLVACAIVAGFIKKDLIAGALSDDCLTLLYTLFGVFGLLLILWEIISYCISKNYTSKSSLILLLVFASVNVMFLVNRIAVYYQDDRKPSTYDIASIIKYNLTPDVEVFTYREYFQDLPIFLNRTIGIIDYIGELEFGVKAEDHSDRIMNGQKFLQKFQNAKNRIFVCMKRDDYNKFFLSFNCSYRILDVTKDFVLVINK